MLSFAVLLLIKDALAYSRCDKVNYPYANRSITNIPLTSSGSYQLTTNGVTKDITFAGTLSIIDGCTFSVKDLLFNGPSTAAWYGGLGSVSDASSVAVRLTPDTLNAGQKYTATYGLSQNAGAWVSFADFNEFRLFDAVTGTMIAVVDIPGNGVPPSYTTNPGGLPTQAAGSAVSSGAAAPTQASDNTSAAPASSNSDGNGLGAGAIVGIAIGSACALLLSVGLGVFLYRQSQNAKNAAAVGSQSQDTLGK